MRLLELFSGTGSIGRAFEAEGWEVISLDIHPPATIITNIMDWDYQKYPPGHFDFIWASPPCTEYSIARTKAKRPRDFDSADAIVARTLKIIEYFEPLLWLLESPATGYLKTRPIMAGLPSQDVTYCRYGYAYKKPTRLWGLFPFALRPICTHQDPCHNVVNGRHTSVAQRRGHTLADLYSIPPELCRQIARMAQFWLE